MHQVAVEAAYIAEEESVEYTPQEQEDVTYTAKEEVYIPSHEMPYQEEKEDYAQEEEDESEEHVYALNHTNHNSEEYQKERSVNNESIAAEDVTDGDLGISAENGVLLSTSLDVPDFHIANSDEQENNSRNNRFRDVMLARYAPASVIVDSGFAILDFTPKIIEVFLPDSLNFVDDYLAALPDYDRIRIEEAVNQVLASRDSEAPIIIDNLNSAERELSAEISYSRDLIDGVDCAQIVYEYNDSIRSTLHNVDSSGGKGKPEIERGHVSKNGEEKNEEPPLPLIEDSYLNVVASAPFPILVHAEGGQIVESSPAWYYMAGVSKAEAPTITEWIKKVKGHRINLKDPELKKVYDEKGVVCISIHTANHDTKLLAFHSYFLGKDSKGRKLTLTMALDITTYPGNSSIGITPESADYGLATKKAFLANMSHEIRTPLTSMIGFADYLVDNLSGQDVQFAQYISESGNRLLETLNSVMRIASMSTVEQTLKYEMLDVTGEVQNVLQLYKPQAEQYDLAVKLVVERPAKAVLDRAALRRVVANLLGNAIKFYS